MPYASRIFRRCDNACRVLRGLWAWSLLIVGLSAGAVVHRYHVQTDTDYGPLTVQEFSGGTWNHHIDLTWYGPSYGSGAGYQVDATLPDSTAYTVRVAGAGLPTGTLVSKTFNSGTSFDTTIWDLMSGPASYKLRASITNDTDQVRIMLLDLGCDGTVDERITLQPGESALREYSQESETTLCVDSGRLGPDGEIIKDLPWHEFGSGDWSLTNGTPPVVGTAVKPGDNTRPSPPTPNAITWSAGAGTNAITTAQEGFGTLRSTIVEGGKENAELLRQIATNTARLDAKIGSTSNATDAVAWRLGMLPSASNSITAGATTVSSAVTTIAGNVVIGSSTNFDWLVLELAGQTVDLRPQAWPEEARQMRSWFWHAMSWILWFILGAAMTFRSRDSINALMATPAAQSGFLSLTGAISPFTLVVSAVMLGIFVTAAGVATTAAANAFTNAVLADGPFLQGYPILEAGISLAAFLFPLGDLFGTVFAYVLFEVVLSVSTILAGLSLRLMAQ